MMPFGKPRAIARSMLMVAAVSFSGAAFAADGAEEWLRNRWIGNYRNRNRKPWCSQSNCGCGKPVYRSCKLYR